MSKASSLPLGLRLLPHPSSPSDSVSPSFQCKVWCLFSNGWFWRLERIWHYKHILKYVLYKIPSNIWTFILMTWVRISKEHTGLSAACPQHVPSLGGCQRSLGACPLEYVLALQRENSLSWPTVRNSLNLLFLLDIYREIMKGKKGNLTRITCQSVYLPTSRSTHLFPTTCIMSVLSQPASQVSIHPSITWCMLRIHLWSSNPPTSMLISRSPFIHPSIHMSIFLPISSISLPINLEGFLKPSK